MGFQSFWPKWLLLLAVAAGIVAPTTSLAKTYRLTPKSRWVTILASENLRPGDEIVFSQGVYRNDGNIIIRQRGTADRPIVIRAAKGARVLFDAGKSGRNHRAFRNVLMVEGCQHLRIQGLELTGGSSGIRMFKYGKYHVEHVTIEDCHIHHVGNCAVAANHPDNRYVGIVLRRNHIHHTAGVGEAFYLGANDAKGLFIDGIIEQNYIHHLTGPKVEQGDGIEIKQGSYNNIIRDNVIHDTQYPAILVYGTRGKAPNIIERNVIWGCQTHAIQAASDAVIRNNIIFDCRHNGIHSQNHQGAIPGDLTIVNNTVYAQGTAIHVSRPSEGALSGPIVIANNALYAKKGPVLNLPRLEGFTVAANFGFCNQDVPFDAEEWQESARRTADFTAFAKRDAHLRPDSMLRGAANSEYLPSDDFNGRLRGHSNDVGAYVAESQPLASGEIRDGFKVMLPLAIATSSVVLEEKVEGAQRVVVGDPQLKTDHPWFPGELSCSTFERLFATQAALYERVTGRKADTDEDKAIASWYWRNLNFYHNYSPRENYWDQEISAGIQDNKDVVYEYWSGLFSYGFSLCGTTHAQYTAEMEHLLGHCRSRAVSVPGHTAFEVFLKDKQYGPDGDWALLDHDVSAIVFDDPTSPSRLLNLWDIAYAGEPPSKTARPLAERESMLDNTGAPKSNRGWFKSGLYFPKENTDATDADTMGGYADVYSLLPLSGYAAVTPRVSLRRNEVLRRYLQPGLGKETYVYWGPNMNSRGIPGPGRDRTWACEPERMFRATRDTETADVARYGNAVYMFKPNFADGSYRDAVIAEDEKSVTLFFHSPYAIGATPAADQADEPWGTLLPGCTNGLMLAAKKGTCSVQLSSDHGRTWSETIELAGGTRIDLTDEAKGLHSYYLRLNASAVDLAKMGIAVRTVCMANDRLIPHLKSEGSTVTFASTGTATFSVGPNVRQAQGFITAGGFGQDHVEMTIASPNGARIQGVTASAQVASKNPPDESVRYQIEVSTDGGTTWQSIVRDWQIERMGYQVEDYFSKSYCYGTRQLTDKANEVVLRFSNDGGVQYQRTEAQLTYETPNNSPLRVTFQWAEGKEGENATVRKSSRVFLGRPDEVESTWEIATGANVETDWVEMQLDPHGP